MEITTNLTKEQLKNAAPKNLRHDISDDLVTTINDVASNHELAADFRENVLSYLDVLQDGKWKFTDYISAIKYVSYKLRGDTAMQAYTKTFPERSAKHIANGHTDYSGWVTAYSKSKLVSEIIKRSLIPIYLANADIYQKAINTQARLMVGAKSEKVQCDAANSLLGHLKPPEDAKLQIDVNVKQEDGISDLTKATLELVKAQKLSIESGASTAKEIAHSSLIIDVIPEKV